MHAFWLVLTYDLLEDRRIDDVIVFIQIDPNIKARLYEIDRASTASSLTSKSENPQFS